MPMFALTWQWNFIMIQSIGDGIILQQKGL